MPRKKSPEELTAEELRRLLVEKRRSSRQDRLEHFRKTGRVISVAPDIESVSLDGFQTSPVTDVEEDSSSAPRRRRRAFDGFLLVVEILAVIGLVFVLFNGLEVIREMRFRLVDEGQALPQHKPYIDSLL